MAFVHREPRSTTAQPTIRPNPLAWGGRVFGGRIYAVVHQLAFAFDGEMLLVRSTASRTVNARVSGEREKNRARARRGAL